MKKLTKARSLNMQIDNIKAELLDGHMDTLEDTPFQAENAENLCHALQCYIDYGEEPISGNLEDFYEAYAKALADKTN